MMQQLKLMPQEASTALYKALKSAVANAVHNHGLNENALIICNLMINEGPSSKRYRMRARGRMCTILRKSCHIKLSVKEGKG